MVFHVLNRANERIPIFRSAGDYRAFEQVMTEGLEKVKDMRLLAYCVMPNHFHMVLWPQTDEALSRFMHWLTCTHVRRLRACRQNPGNGHVYRGPFKAFAVQDDEHLLAVCRYVERNPLRAGLVQSAGEWAWSSAGRSLGCKKKWSATTLRVALPTSRRLGTLRKPPPEQCRT